MSAAAAKNCYAVLIGINDYPKKPLSGCVNDALAVHDYFTELCSEAVNAARVNWLPRFYLAPDEQSKALLAARGFVPVNTPDEAQAAREKGQTPYLPPTREQILSSFRHFDEASAEREDLCLFHYSGHGSYVFDFLVPVFQGYEDYGQLQTLVCADNPRKDILDKELAYLITKTLHNKQYKNEDGRLRGVHFLCTMDCCYSGTNARGGTRINRMSPGRKEKIDETEIVGFRREGNCYYTPFAEGQTRVQRDGGLTPASYFSLAASRGDEESYEDRFMVERALGEEVVREEVKHGIFTYSLLRVLRRVGPQQSYRELMNLLEREIGGKSSSQMPAYEYSFADEEYQYFLGNTIKPPERSYRVLHENGKWRLNAGYLAGLRLFPGNQPSATIRVEDGSGKERLVKIESISARSAELDQDAFGPDDFDEKGEPRDLRAGIHRVFFDPINIAFDESVPEELRQSLSSKKEENLPYFQFVAEDVEPDFVVRSELIENGTLLSLTKSDSKVALFPEDLQVLPFLEHLNKVAKWELARRLENPDPASELDKSRFTIACKARVVPGLSADLDIGLFNEEWDMPSEQDLSWTYPKPVEVEYPPGKQVCLGVLLSHNASIPKGQAFYVGAMFLNTDFEIRTDYLPQSARLSKGQLFLRLRFPHRDQWMNAIPMAIDSYFVQQGITEVEDYLKIVISEEPIDLEAYRQSGILLDTTRSKGEEEGEPDDQPIEQIRWTVFNIPIRLRLVR